MISHEYKLIFIHIPKCAGTSIETAFNHFNQHTANRSGQDHRTIRMIQQPVKLSNVVKSKENFLDYLRRIRKRYTKAVNPKNNLQVTAQQYNDYYKFTFVRNPWTRAYSWYKNVVKDEIHRKEHKVTSTISFKDFLKQYAGKGMLCPQTYWIKDFSGDYPYDFIGKFENLQHDFQMVVNDLGLSDIKLPHKIKGSSHDYHEHYDKELIDLVGNVYQEEIEMFNYEFQ